MIPTSEIPRFTNLKHQPKAKAARLFAMLVYASMFHQWLGLWFLRHARYLKFCAVLPSQVNPPPCKWCLQVQIFLGFHQLHLRLKNKEAAQCRGTTPLVGDFKSEQLWWVQLRLPMPSTLSRGRSAWQTAWTPSTMGEWRYIPQKVILGCWGSPRSTQLCHFGTWWLKQLSTCKFFFLVV